MRIIGRMGTALDYRFESGRTLVLEANVANGWRKERRDPNEERKTYCFSELVRAEWQGGFIKAQLTILPWPPGLEPEWDAPPAFTEHAARKLRHRSPLMIRRIGRNRETKLVQQLEDCCTIAVSTENVLVLSIELLDERMERNRALDTRGDRNGDQLFERIATKPVHDRPYRECQIQLRLTFLPPRRPAPEYRSFWNRFLPGGLPETDRRKF